MANVNCELIVGFISGRTAVTLRRAVQWRTEYLTGVGSKCRGFKYKMEWGQGEVGSGGWSGFRVDWEEKHDWRLNRDADPREDFLFCREAACVSIESARERNELVTQSSRALLKQGNMGRD